eukprot:g23684.t1
MPWLCTDPLEHTFHQLPIWIAKEPLQGHGNVDAFRRRLWSFKKLEVVCICLKLCVQKTISRCSMHLLLI